MANNTLRNALSDALKGDEEPGAEGTAEAEATDQDADPSSEGTESTGDDDKLVEGTEETPYPGDDSEPPTEYFGVDLSGLSAEERREVISGYQERDKYIQQLLRDKSADTGSDETVEAPDSSGEDDSAMTDEELLAALGVDKDDPFSESTAKVALPLAKMVLSLNEQVAALSQKSELDSTERYWTTGLAALQAEHGKLPSGITPEAVMREAAKQGIAEPVDAYWRIMGPGRQAVMVEVQKRLAALQTGLKQGTTGTTRPSSQVDSSEKIIDAKDVKEATRLAFAQIAKERGLT